MFLFLVVDFNSYINYNCIMYNILNYYIHTVTYCEY